MHWQLTAWILATSLALLGAALAGSPADIARAAEEGDAEAVHSMLAAGADPNAAQDDGTTALHWAAYRDDDRLAESLVAAGADVNAANRYGLRPISLACTNRNARLVKLLLDAGADPNAVVEGGETVLMTAARSGSLGAVQALLAAGAEVEATERNAQTALMWAAAEGHADVAQALIDAGDIAAAEALLAAGVDVNEPLQRRIRPQYQHANSGMSPLLLAIENGHFELAVELLEGGADPNDERTGFTPLHTITWVRKPKVSDYGSDPAPEGSGNLSTLQFVRTLVAMGADVNARLKNGRSQAPKINVQGSTPFLFAADKADVPLMKLLLELGADPFLPNVEGTTPLMVAAGLGTTAPMEEAGTEEEAFEATKLLLDLGAEINTVDDNGETAMHGAVYGSFPSVIQLLADSGADPDLWKRPNKHGWTPLFIAEGYRPGNFKPAPHAIAAIRGLMAKEGLSTEGPRPRHIDTYEKIRLANKAP